MRDKLKICKKSCLGPTFGGPIRRLLILNPNDTKNEYQDKYLAYATKDKVILRFTYIGCWDHQTSTRWKPK